MNKRLSDLLSNQGDNYILPFFWQHGESEAVLREYMAKIQESNIGAVCVEARPHPDFAGEQWWHDLDIIIEEARNRNMKVWILDDAHFPTGYANGLLKKKPDSLRKQYVMYKSAVTAGPIAGGRLNVGKMARTVPMPGFGQADTFGEAKDQDTFDDDQFLGLVAYKVLPDNRLDISSVVDLGDKVKDGWLTWDVPAGEWRLFILYLTRNGGGNTSYINMIDPASCAVQIEAVYQPHYERYKNEFGKTIAGFFSDEPCIGNTFGYEANKVIGRKNMPLPWQPALPNLLNIAMGRDWQLKLPLLWFEGQTGDETAAQTRYAYMDIISRLIESSFSRQIGEWCSDHGVEYIGHIIEDNNQHSHLGSSMGHFFRSMAGQHMSGIDDIGNQVLPGCDNATRYSIVDGDGEFYHYMLGKLGSSLGHIDPIKKGRTMCEIFGAYGWREGVRMMKWLADHFLIRGVNHFVPHAFSPKDFPDPDCPPHFFAHGHNPQFRHFGSLMRYMNRMSHLLNGGQLVAPAAILYHGESSWTGKTQLMQKPARVLTECQIDFDVLPSDVFSDMDAFNTQFGGGVLSVNNNSYRCLIIPTTEYLTTDVANFAVQAQSEGFPVIFVDELPIGLADGNQTGRSLPDKLSECPVASLDHLPNLLDSLNIRDIRIAGSVPHLRAMHYVTDTDQFMFFNESLSKTIDVQVELPVKGDICRYDAWQNKTLICEREETADGSRVRLVLEPYESCFLICGESGQHPASKRLADLKTVKSIEAPWSVSFANAKSYPAFSDAARLEALVDLSIEKPFFSGTVRYETTFELDQVEGGEELLIEEANEAVEVWVNDQPAGLKICPPYRFAIDNLLKAGLNRIRIEATNTLANEMRDNTNPILEMFIPPTVEAPVGLSGRIEIRR